MDNFTLIVSAIFISFFSMVTTYFLYRTSTTEKYLIDWTISGAFFLTSNLVRAFAVNFEIPKFIISTIANTAYIAGHVAILTGVLRLTCDKNIRHIIPWAILIVAALHQLAIIQQSIEHRMLLLFPMTVCINIVSLFYLWSHRKQSPGAAFWPLMFALSFYIFEISLRGVLIFVDPVRYPMQGNQLMQTLGTLFLMIFLFMLTISFTLILNWKRELELRKTSVTDKLTGWLNRNDFDNLVSNGFDTCKQTGASCGFIYFDIDHFKTINDKFGHNSGDAALKHVCNIALQQSRNSDHHFRMGGEEFVIFVSDTDSHTINKVAERIRQNIANSPLELKDKIIDITISIGITISDDTDKNWESMLDRADKALYQSKNTGRNCVTQIFPLSDNHKYL